MSAHVSVHFILPWCTFIDIKYSRIALEYRSGIFTHTPEQLEIAKEVTARVQKEHFDPKGQKIATVIEPAGMWWNAEEYHQKYLFNNPTGYQCPTHRLQW